ncbi:T9SS type A sorting domain-containing protein [Membranihabitans marinus]|uniref:T9SS type A sorting domain-containing protein n=1 Tax=Membranihabitans marinus TaxID=1227546 RepID=UPI001F45D757|nr:T9SS type A sorting domain-containing protein [Membranihabitans marinus]
MKNTFNPKVNAMHYFSIFSLNMVFILLLFTPKITQSQTCRSVFTSSNGYQVIVDLTFGDIVLSDPGAPCTNGYNYKVEIDYDITFTGVNIPSNLYTLQGKINCNGTEIFFDLPNSGGSGTTLSSQDYRNNNDCSTATPISLGCAIMSTKVTAQGPSLNWETKSCTASGSLPLVWENFSVKYNNQYSKNEVNWSTFSEINCDKFEIERSTDNVHWEVIAETSAKGEANTTTSYSQMLPKEASKYVFYRIKQIDVDGSFTFSNTVLVDNSSHIDTNELNVYPNPAQQYTTVSLKNIQADKVRIYSSTGKNLTSAINFSLGSTNQLIMDLSAIPSGLYYLSIDNVNKKLLVQH